MQETIKIREGFFNAASAAALESFEKYGKVKVAVTALLQTPNGLELMPVDLDANMDIRLIEDHVDKAMEPVAAACAENPGSRVVVFFIAAKGQGVAKEGDGELKSVDVLINGARSEGNIGKTTTYEIVKKDKKYEFTQLSTGTDDGQWVAEPDEKNMPGIVIQTILKSVWMSYIILRNLNYGIK